MHSDHPVVWLASARLVEEKKTYHLRSSNKPLLQNNKRLRPEIRRLPNDQVCQLAHFHTPHQMTDPLRQRRIHRVLTNVPLNAVIIRACILVFMQLSALQFILVCCVPGAQDDLAAAAHGLGIGGHHADGAGVMEHVFRRDSFGADTAVCEGDVFGDVFG